MSTYIIWNPSSTQPPQKTFSGRPEAIKIAGKMANDNPGETFYVAKLTNSARKPVSPSTLYQDLDK